MFLQFCTLSYLVFPVDLFLSDCLGHILNFGPLFLELLFLSISFLVQVVCDIVFFSHCPKLLASSKVEGRVTSWCLKIRYASMQ